MSCCAKRAWFRIYDIFFDSTCCVDGRVFPHVIQERNYSRHVERGVPLSLRQYVRERERALVSGRSRCCPRVCGRCSDLYVVTRRFVDRYERAALALEENKCTIDPNLDVTKRASIVLTAKRGGGKSGVFICGAGSPKNFMLQTEPQIQETRDR